MEQERPEGLTDDDLQTEMPGTGPVPDGNGDGTDGDGTDGDGTDGDGTDSDGTDTRDADGSDAGS